MKEPHILTRIALGQTMSGPWRLCGQRTPRSLFVVGDSEEIACCDSCRRRVLLGETLRLFQNCYRGHVRAPAAVRIGPSESQVPS